MMKINFYPTGNLDINNLQISSTFNSLEFETIFLGFNISIFKIKKSLVYRIQPDEKWLDYIVESITVEFNSGRCRKISFALVGEEDTKVESVVDLRISRHLQRIFKITGNISGKSELKFEFQFFKIIVAYDFKLSSPNLEVQFKA